MFFSRKFSKFKTINHCFFSRNGGRSKGIYKSLNCGQGSKDNKKNIDKNIAIVSKKMRVNKRDLKLMNQTFDSPLNYPAT